MNSRLIAVRSRTLVLGSRTRILAGTAALAAVLLSLIPPNGALSPNEEDYFAIAARFVGGSVWPDTTAVFDSSRHRMLSDASLGTLVSLIDYTPAQIVTRLIAVAGYTLVLPRLFGALALSALDAAIVVMVMALIGQDISGGEWLFGDYEGKVAAYILVLAALRLVLTRDRLNTATLLLVLATYFHFLVGGFWFVAVMALRLLDRSDLRHVALNTSLYILTVAPLFIVIAWTRLADNSASLATDVPTPDVIYSIIREPHHQSPFLSWRYFRDHWLPGYVMALPMLLSCIWFARRAEIRKLRIMAWWLAGLFVYLFLVLGPKYLDRDTGFLGKFYLFRPSSLIELLWLTLVLAFAVNIARNRAWLIRIALLATVGPAFCYVQSGRLIEEMQNMKNVAKQKSLMEEAVRQLTSPGSVVLIDPDAETNWLDFERRTGRPTWVSWKFAPTNDAELITWYRRIEARWALFQQNCGPDIAVAQQTFLLTTVASASRLSAGCGPELFRTGPWVLLQKQVRQ
jgi:Domain of unknown function (DUF6798)